MKNEFQKDLVASISHAKSIGPPSFRKEPPPPLPLLRLKTAIQLRLVPYSQTQEALDPIAVSTLEYTAL